jgi:hypothetical protein
MRPATFDIESDHLRPPALLAPNWATASALHDLSPDEGGDVKFVEQAGTVADPGLGEHELPARPAASRSPSKAATTERPCSYPVIARTTRRGRRTSCQPGTGPVRLGQAFGSHAAGHRHGFGGPDGVARQAPAAPRAGSSSRRTSESNPKSGRNPVTTMPEASTTARQPQVRKSPCHVPPRSRPPRVRPVRRR